MIKNIFKLMMVAMVLLGPVSAYAQTPDLFNKLAVAEDLSEQERLVKKVSLTENALNQAVARVEKIETDLNALTFAENSKETTSRQAFLADMESHKNFYNQKLETLSQIGSLSDVNTLIQEIIDYRETVYSPATKSALEFLLVFSYSPTALETANNRLSKISEDLTKLTRLNLIEREEFSALISEAETKLTGAERLQAISRAKLLGEEFIEEIIENTTSTEEIIIEEELDCESLWDCSKAEWSDCSDGIKIRNLDDCTTPDADTESECWADEYLPDTEAECLEDTTNTEATNDNNLNEDTEEEVPFFTWLNLLVMLGILTGYYYYKSLET